MSKSIKIKDEVYAKLLTIQRPRETISEVIARAVAAYMVIVGIRDGLPASHFLQERPKQEVTPGESLG